MDLKVDQLIEAASRGDLDTVKRLIAQGADIDAKGEFWNPLHVAIEHQQIEVVRFLICSRADLEFICLSTPIARAVDLIIDGANQNRLSIDRCSKQLIDMLLDAGAQVEPGLKGARAHRCAAVEEHLLKRSRSEPVPGAASTIAGTIGVPDTMEAAAFFESAGLTIGKAGLHEFEARGEGFEIYLESGAPVLAYGSTNHPHELVRKLAKSLDDAGVRHFFEVYDPSGKLKEMPKLDFDDFPVIAGTVGLPDPRAAVFILERAGWRIRKAGWHEFEIRDDDFEIYIESESPVLIHGLAAYPGELARKLAKAFNEADVPYSFEVYGPSEKLIEVIAPEDLAP